MKRESHLLPCSLFHLHLKIAKGGEIKKGHQLMPLLSFSNILFQMLGKVLGHVEHGDLVLAAENCFQF
jgi:hypothetical protein